MKKLVLILAVVILSITSLFAQKDEKTIGANLNYGGEIGSFGLGAKFTYNITDVIRLAPSLNYYFRHNYTSLFAFDADAHYLFPLEGGMFTAYPLAGITFQSWNFDVAGGLSWTRLGINLGGGIQYDFDSQWRALGELKYSVVNDFDQLVLTLGIAYKF